MWIFYALGSAIFAGITAVLAKIGVKHTDSHLATALRTVVVLLFSWLMVWVAGSAESLPFISAKSYIFLFLSALTTGGSWICYFRALHLGDVNKVAPIDKSSLILTMLLAFLILGDPIRWNMLMGMAAIGLGTWMMIQKQSAQADAAAKPDKRWMVWAVFSAVFASLTAILAKIGIEQVESNLATALRTAVVLPLAWGIVFAQGTHREIRRIDRKSWVFLLLSGLATGLSWLCYYKALHDGPASIVAPIDKLSILFTIGFSRLLLKEKLSKKAGWGLALITLGTLALLLPVK